MDKCRYGNKAIYAFEIYDKDNNINDKYVKFLKEASKEGKLTCDFCKEKVRFNMGKKNSPYFSHILKDKNHLCNGLRESEEHIKGKKILFLKLVEDYPEAFGEISYLFDSDVMADIYFKFDDDTKLVLEYEDVIWDEKKESSHKKFYEEQDIIYKRFINAKVENLNITEAAENMGYLNTLIDFNFEEVVALDADKKEIILFAKLPSEYNKEHYNEVLYKRYRLNDVKINKDGNILCDFKEEINRLKKNQDDYIKNENNIETIREINNCLKEETAKEIYIEENKNDKEVQQLSLFDLF